MFEERRYNELSVYISDLSVLSESHICIAGGDGLFSYNNTDVSGTRSSCTF